MPYTLQQTGGGYKVRKKGSGKTFSKKPMSKQKAKAQMAAMYANESFEAKLDTVLFEGFPRPRPGIGSTTAKGNMPYDYDPEETDVDLEYDWEDPEPQTRDYPGSPGGVSITNIITSDGHHINPDDLPPEILQQLEQFAHSDQEERRQNALADYEHHLDSRREERGYR